MKYFLIFLLFINISFASYYYQDGKKIYITEVDKSRTNKNISRYKNELNQEIGIARDILVKFKKDVDIEKILKEYNLTLKERLSSIYLLEANSTAHALESSAKLVENNIAIFAHPDFLQKVTDRALPLKRELPKDKMFMEYGYHLKDTTILSNAHINVEKAWQYSKGENVKVGIFDTGIDLTHEEFRDKEIVTYDTITDTDMAFTTDAHGTFIAGLMVADENGKGVVGVSPKSDLVFIKMNPNYSLGDMGTFTSKLIKGFIFAKEQNIDVLNCSWGTYNRQDALVEIVQDLIKSGRDGKGMLIFFGIGNANCNEDGLCDEDYDGYGDGYLQNDESTIDGVFTIGSHNYQNERAFYSNYGKFLDFTAFGGDYTYPLVSTDISGYLGYSSESSFDNLDYTEAVGTSFASPIVASVSALMLSVNPDLTKDDIFEIFKITSKKIGNYEYIDGKSLELGYGKIDATKAVKFAYMLKSLKNSTFNIKWYFWLNENRAYLAQNPENLSIWEFTNERLWKPIHNASAFDGYIGAKNSFDKTDLSLDKKSITLGNALVENNFLVDSLSNKSFGINWYFFATEFGTFIASNRDREVSVWEFTDTREWMPLHNASKFDSYLNSAKYFFDSVEISEDGNFIKFN